jgi:hypothetical protein
MGNDVGAHFVCPTTRHLGLSEALGRPGAIFVHREGAFLAFAPSPPA